VENRDSSFWRTPESRRFRKQWSSHAFTSWPVARMGPFTSAWHQT